jgi:hypothetical protein
MLLKKPFLFLLSLLMLYTAGVSAQCVATIAPAVAAPCYGATDTLYATYAVGNTYQWYYAPTAASGYAAISGATSRSYPTTLGGYYKVYIQNGSCSIFSSPYNLAFYQPATPAINLSGTDSICPGQTVIISANTGNQITYQWYRDGLSIPGFTGTSITTSASGNYSVTETDQYGCSATSPTLAIVQRWAPIPVLNPAGQVAVCDSPTTIISTYPYASTAYKWSRLAGGNYNIIPGAFNTSYTASASGTYQLTATYSNGCMETSAPVTATFAATPPVPTVTASSPVCLGSTLVFNVTNAALGYNYSWHGPNSFTSTAQNPNFVAGSPLDSGNYTVTVSNSGCLNTAIVHVAVTCLDSVWPGDVNADHIVDYNDALDLALGWGYTGPARAAVSNNFAAQFCSDWNSNIIGSVNRKHADCNGDGGIDSNDLTAIYNNYGDVHAKGIHTAQAKTAGSPNLYFDLTDYPYLYPGHTVSIPIKLGGSATPMYNIMGIAADIKIAGLILATPPTITYPVSWLGSAGNTLHFAKIITGGNSTSNSIGWAYARTDHQNTTGEGTLANLNFTVPQGIGYNSWAFLYMDNVTIINNNGTTLTGYNVVDDTTIANPTAITPIAVAVSLFATIAPNPSAAGAQTYLKIDLPAPATLYVSITDILGRSLWAYTADAQGKQNIALPTNMNAGTYFIHMQRTSDNLLQILRWVKD